LPFKAEGVRLRLGRFRNQAQYVVWGSKGTISLGRGATVLPGVIREPVRTVEKHHMTGKPTALIRQLVNDLRKRRGVSSILLLGPVPRWWRRISKGTTGRASK